MTVVIDTAESARYQRELDRYLRRIVSADGVFCCDSATDWCRPSVATGSLAGGQLSYVGNGYATRDERRDLRILVVSMQVGDAEAPVTMTRRSEQVRVRIDQPPAARNAHMRGVTFALQLLFGREPTADAEVLDDGTHVLDAYAMANSTLCSNLPTDGASRRGAPTPTMLQRCREHLRNTVEILRPTIIHTQGMKKSGPSTRSAFEASVDSCERVSEWNALVRIGDLEAVWCSLPHPSAGPPQAWQWTTLPFFSEVVAPNLREARSLALTR